MPLFAKQLSTLRVAEANAASAVRMLYELAEQAHEQLEEEQSPEARETHARLIYFDLARTAMCAAAGDGEARQTLRRLFGGVGVGGSVKNRK